VTKAEPSYGVSDHYLGERGSRYAQQKTMHTGLRPSLLAERFQPFIRHTDTVVDFGCAGGEIIAALRCDRRIGIDANPTSREMASSLGIECFASVAEVAPGVADVVISSHTLEHVPYPIAALRELRQLLKPDAMLVVTLPIDDWRKQKRYNPNDGDHHLHTWTPQLFGNTLNEAGFNILSIRLYPSYIPRRMMLLYPHIPRQVFDVICSAWAVARRRNELLAIARPRPT
jgi:SAM-dependent methyltransferase